MLLVRTIITIGYTVSSIDIYYIQCRLVIARFFIIPEMRSRMNHVITLVINF